MPVSYVQTPPAELELDVRTQEWVEAFEGPSVALRPDGYREDRATVEASEEQLDARTEDWLKSQVFPVRPLYSAPQRAAVSVRTPGSAGARTRWFILSAGESESFEPELTSKLVVGSTSVQGKVALTWV